MENFVSIIIPSYNAAHYLPDAINSILEQTYSNWELIVVNDGSTDAIDEIIKPFITKDKRIKYFNKKNGGLGSARNFGIKKASGNYILPLDADDKFEPSFIEKAVNCFLKKNNLKIVYCEASYFGDAEGKWFLPDYSYDNMLLSNMIFASAMFKRIDYKAIGGYDETILYEDWDFWLRLLKNGGEVYKIPEVLFFYRKHSQGSLMNELSKKNKRHTFSLQTIFEKNRDAFLNVYGNPIEIELKRQKLERRLKHPIYKWVENNRKSLIVRLLTKYLK